MNDLPFALPHALQLGPFVIHERVGQGGMGEVWRGHHVSQRVPVAVKVLAEDYSNSASFLESFRAEVRAVAALRHRRVVMVFDHGQIPESVADASCGVFESGQPYLVMELATGGTLQSLGAPSEYRTLRETLLAVLDALAHAHARGVIHRDVKPANVLLCGPSDTRPGIKLSDFGLAAAGDRRHAERLVGTPAFMAPEQCDGRWRDHGPWTDLYAFGCLAYAITAGRLPFDDTNPMQVVLQQFADEPPPLKPKLPVPAGFEAWIRKLMAKSPSDRYRWAADAAWALRSLGMPEPDRSPLPAADAQPTRQLTSGLTLTGNLATGAAAPRKRSFAQLSTSSHHSSSRRGATAPGVIHERSTGAPLPTSWRRSQGATAQSLQLLGVGLGLFGLRSIPQIGRIEERDRLWHTLLRIHGAPGAQACLISGEAGVGKTRLAMSIAQRAHEVGAANLLYAAHSGTAAGASEGLPRMLLRFLHGQGLSRSDLRTLIANRLGQGTSVDIDAVTELILPATAQDLVSGARAVRFATPDERYETVLQFLAHFAAERPLVVQIDDAQWGHDALAFVRYVLRGRNELPLLFLITVRGDDLQEHPLARSVYRDLREYDATIEVAVRPLAGREHAALVRELLGLEGSLATEVEARSDGNPLFAVQLVGDLVERGVLEAGPQGFRLKPNATALIPDDIHQLWVSRLARVLENTPRSGAIALEIAAALGTTVATGEWTIACRLAGVAIPEHLVEAMLATGLATSFDDGWSFAHAMFRESVQRTATEAGRWSMHNLRCAEMVSETAVDPERGRAAERRGRYLAETDRLEEAARLLLSGAQARYEASDYPVCIAILDGRDEVLHRLGLVETDVRWAEGFMLRAVALRVIDQVEEAEGWIARSLALLGDDPATRMLRARALEHFGGIRKETRDFDSAESSYREALALSDESQSALRARCRWGLGVLAMSRGDLAEAQKELVAARTLANEAGAFLAAGDAAYQLGGLAMHAGNLGAAEAYVSDARDIMSRAGHRHGVALCLNGLGEIRRAQERQAESESLYRESLRLSLASGASGATARVNLGQVLLASGRANDARGAFELVLQERAAGLGVYARVGKLACDAVLHAFDAVDAELDNVSSELKTSRDADLARMLEHAATALLHDGQVGLAQRVVRLAAGQWSAVGEVQRAQRLLQVLAEQGPH